MDHTTLANDTVVSTLTTNLTNNGFIPHVVKTKEEALATIKTLIPAGASVNNGSSTTLTQIGFIDYLKDASNGWKNTHGEILAESDPAKQSMLRKTLISDYFLASAHAITESGQIVIASASGSQLPSIIFNSPNIILVVGTHKITKDLNTAFSRIRDYVFPLEDARMKSTGAAGSVISKILTLEKEPAFMGRKFHVILVNEVLGF